MFWADDVDMSESLCDPFTNILVACLAFPFFPFFCLSSDILLNVNAHLISHAVYFFVLDLLMIHCDARSVENTCTLL